MKLTIWEKHNIYTLLGTIQDAPWKDLEIVRDLREKFKGKELPAWGKYARLLVASDDQLSDEQAQFVREFGKKIHSETEKINLTKREFLFIYEKVSGNQVRLPARELLDYSIAFKQKLEKTKEEVDLI